MPVTVKFHAAWCDDRHSFEVWRRHLKDGDRWNDLVLILDGEPDWWVVLNHPRPGFKVAPERTLCYQFEPSWIRWEWPYPWQNPSPDLVAGCHPISRHHMPFHWAETYRKSWLDLASSSPVKSKTISAVISEKSHSNLARVRRDFIVNHASKIEEIDVYGRWKQPPCPTYCGALRDKSDGLLPYRYTVAVENCQEVNYFTEKITDAILSETLAFYSGCPNLCDFVDPECFIEVDFSDGQEACRIIQETIASGQWEVRLAALRREKQRILQEKHFYADLERHISLITDAQRLM